ncbi:P-loop containing nucleoside triphosphate hydrolase protein [Auriculariales sp. MPI-PUGE-AT-0066]|nr:P-loop containing nucleoside triphosphate hydrolase protein [Auriculariales sp. MPI-PUGE-AT-0066]
METSSHARDGRQSPSVTSISTNPTPSPRPASAHNSYTPPQPSIRLLYSFLSGRDVLLCILPAIAFSIAAGGVAPFMTVILGQAFNVFATYPREAQTSDDKHTLLKGVGAASLNLLALAIGSFALTTGMSAIWISAGERNVMRLRKRVYEAVSSREMQWFDAKLGGDDDNGEEKLGPGGLMAKFAKDTDDVREASSLAMGQLVQYLVTFITALVLAFRASWALTLVILATVPVSIVIQVISQTVAGPLLAGERSAFAHAGDVISRAISSIATVKAFNAVRFETGSFEANLSALRRVTYRETGLWGVQTALTQFTMLSMFVQGFWFGSHLMRKGQLSFGDVVQVFWACLVAASNFQMTIPLLITIAKGKWAMVSLVTLINPPPTELPSPRNSRSSVHYPISPSAQKSTLFPLAKRTVAANLRKIRPVTAAGEIVLRNVSFSYPSRPDRLALDDVSMFLPAKEMTFIAGPSGSGKSTIAQLLLRMYEPNMGSVDLDDQSLDHLDQDFTKEHIAAVAQGCVLFDMNVHENVAMGLAGVPGRTPDDATVDEVIEACQLTKVHDFVKDLPNGYQTKLGSQGANISGGQRQRLALARAKLRDPTVLILDEATSALDPATRYAVFSAIRQWRKGKTTIVITHDLNLLQKTDFVYIMQDSRVVEQGYTEDLETANLSAWKEMRQYSDDAQEPVAYGWAPEITLDTASDIDARLDDTDQIARMQRRASKHASVIGAALRPASGHWMLDAIADLTRSVSPPPPEPTRNEQPSAWQRESYRASTLPRRPSSRAGGSIGRASGSMRPPRPASVTLSSLAAPEASRDSRLVRHASLQFTPTSPTFDSRVHDSVEYEIEKTAMALSAPRARTSRDAPRSPHVQWDEKSASNHGEGRHPTDELSGKQPTPDSSSQPEEKRASLLDVTRLFWPTVPQKWLVFLGVLAAIASGSMTPIFSFLFSRLLVTVANVNHDGMGPITRSSLLVLLVAFGDGLFAGLKYFIMEIAAFNWIISLRQKNFPRILSQDKKWFDEPANTPERIVHILMQDGDDARNLIGTVLAQFLLVASMLTVGFVWALVLGWQLTLAGLAFAPVFAVIMALQARMMSSFELRNKRLREEVARNYHDAIANIREIRSMSFESVFSRQFNDSADATYRAGLIGGFAEGSTVGVASALIYLAEALLFYVGAILMANGSYTYLRMLQVLNLVAFTVTIASQLMAFVEKIAKAVQAAHDFGRLTNLRRDTDESRGTGRQIMDGTVFFKDVSFAYPLRPELPVLRGVSMQLNPGESVAIVGGSGSGKSTIAALLQRLYEPSNGVIAVGGQLLANTDVSYLRNNIAVVSQTPHLFNASVRDNIAYGYDGATMEQVIAAAQAAQIHDFIDSLEKKYDTNIGDKATLLSGGQAQRIQIARALLRPAQVLILDECTSALDPASEAAVIDTLRQIKHHRTTLMITHKVPVMRMCDRILVVQDGHIVEQGSYEELMARRRVFYELTTAGEWA